MDKDKTRQELPSIYAKLLEIQSKLEVPKNQKNTFGNYMYRSAEDILEAVKPLLKDYDCTLTISDRVMNIGTRYYVRATATLTFVQPMVIDDMGNCGFINPETNTISVNAYAREAETKKGMDESQITGSASSYARKYALNGLFAIDDTKDADGMDNSNRTETKKLVSDLASDKQIALMKSLMNSKAGITTKEEYLDYLKEIGYEEGKITKKQASLIIDKLQVKED